MGWKVWSWRKERHEGSVWMCNQEPTLGFHKFSDSRLYQALKYWHGHKQLAAVLENHWLDVAECSAERESENRIRPWGGKSTDLNKRGAGNSTDAPLPPSTSNAEDGGGF